MAISHSNGTGESVTKKTSEEINNELFKAGFDMTLKICGITWNSGDRIK